MIYDKSGHSLDQSVRDAVSNVQSQTCSRLELRLRVSVTQSIHHACRMSTSRASLQSLEGLSLGYSIFTICSVRTGPSTTLPSRTSICGPWLRLASPLPEWRFALRLGWILRAPGDFCRAAIRSNRHDVKCQRDAQYWAAEDHC